MDQEMRPLRGAPLSKAHLTWRVCLFFLLVTSCISNSETCPEFCDCVGNLVSCSYFHVLDLTLLPPDTETLVLSSSELEEVPPAFLARARALKVLSLISVSAKVVRGGAFRGINQLDLLTISRCSFDIVEPEGISGLNEVEIINITKSQFGLVGKHGFADIRFVGMMSLSDNRFETISDEAFSSMYHVNSLRMFHNNMTYIGKDIFMGAEEIDDVNIVRNNIKTIEKGSIEYIGSIALRMNFHNNIFECSCANLWMLISPSFKDYIDYNKCTFTGTNTPSDSTFRLNFVPDFVMCPSKPSTTTASTHIFEGIFQIPDVFQGNITGLEYEEKVANKTTINDTNSTQELRQIDQYLFTLNGTSDNDTYTITEQTGIIHTTPQVGHNLPFDLDQRFSGNTNESSNTDPLKGPEHSIDQHKQIVSQRTPNLHGDSASDESAMSLEVTTSRYSGGNKVENNHVKRPDSSTYIDENRHTLVNNNTGKLAPVVSDGHKHHRPYSTSAVEMDKTNENNSASRPNINLYDLIKLTCLSPLLLMRCL